VTYTNPSENLHYTLIRFLQRQVSQWLTWTLTYRRRETDPEAHAETVLVLAPAAPLVGPLAGGHTALEAEAENVVVAAHLWQAHRQEVQEGMEGHNSREDRSRTVPRREPA
jgi:hypothetical protein